MKIYHYTSKENLSKILLEGLKATSRYEKFSDIRKNVVYCWLFPDHQKIFSEDDICLKIEVEESRCIVAEMDYISFAMMYKYGGKKYGGKNIPINNEASDLFARLYKVTSCAISEYEDNFFTPEVLVQGNIAPDRIKIFK